MGTGGSFRGVKRARHGVEHSPRLALRLKKEWSCTYTPTRALMEGTGTNLFNPLTPNGH